LTETLAKSTLCDAPECNELQSLSPPPQYDFFDCATYAWCFFCSSASCDEFFLNIEQASPQAFFAARQNKRTQQFLRAVRADVTAAARRRK
jgi:hypothetical protein